MSLYSTPRLEIQGPEILEIFPKYFRNISEEADGPEIFTEILEIFPNISKIFSEILAAAVRGDSHTHTHTHTRLTACLFLSLQRSDSLASVYSGAGEGRYGTVAVRGEVEFGLQYNYKQNALEIHVVQCRDLAPVDAKRNRSDP